MFFKLCINTMCFHLLRLKWKRILLYKYPQLKENIFIKNKIIKVIIDLKLNYTSLFVLHTNITNLYKHIASFWITFCSSNSSKKIWYHLKVVLGVSLKEVIASASQISQNVSRCQINVEQPLLYLTYVNFCLSFPASKNIKNWTSRLQIGCQCRGRCQRHWNHIVYLDTSICNVALKQMWPGCNVIYYKFVLFIANRNIFVSVNPISFIKLSLMDMTSFGGRNPLYLIRQKLNFAVTH